MSRINCLANIFSHASSWRRTGLMGLHEIKIRAKEAQDKKCLVPCLERMKNSRRVKQKMPATKGCVSHSEEESSSRRRTRFPTNTPRGPVVDKRIASSAYRVTHYSDTPSRDSPYLPHVAIRSPSSSAAAGPGGRQQLKEIH